MNQTAKPKVKLFLSYSGMLRAIARDEIALDDLHGAVFYFGCARENVMLNPESPDVHVLSTAPTVRGNLEKRATLYFAILSAIIDAEREGRIMYRNDGRTFGRLNELLKLRGLPTFDATTLPFTNDNVRSLLTLRQIKRLELMD